MLEQVMRHVRNYFIKEFYIGEFSISSGMISPHDFLLDGQRFYITGSFLNDGVYTYHADGIKNDDDTETVELNDETFNGTMYLLSIPHGFISLVDEIREWVDTYSEVVNSPYQSESWGGYSYSKGAGGDANGAPTWQSIFKSQLNAYRKVGPV